MIEKKQLIPIIALICLILTVSLLYNADQKSNMGQEEKMSIIVTIPPQAEFVEKIGGEKVSVTVLVPPGANPHTYEPVPSQMKEVAKAKMYAKVGSGIEFEIAWMDKIVETNPELRIVDCSSGIKLIDMEAAHKQEKEGEDEYDHIGRDPHIWLSPKRAIIMVENIYRGLINTDPKNGRYYALNRDSYIKELVDLDRELQETFSGLSTKKFMVYHPTWGYLAEDYGLEQIPIEEKGKSPTPEGIAFLVEQAEDNGIRVIFATPEFETRTAETIAEEIDGVVVLASPLSKDYIQNLRTISQEIARSLQ